MERLTERIYDVPDGESGVFVKQHDYISAAEKLADYEDAEEQGLLLRLPCGIGSDVYIIPSKINYKLNILWIDLFLNKSIFFMQK